MTWWHAVIADEEGVWGEVRIQAVDERRARLRILTMCENEVRDGSLLGGYSVDLRPCGKVVPEACP